MMYLQACTVVCKASCKTDFRLQGHVLCAPPPSLSLSPQPGLFSLVPTCILYASLLDQGNHPLCYFTLSDAKQFYSSRESLWVGNG